MIRGIVRWTKIVIAHGCLALVVTSFLGPLASAADRRPLFLESYGETSTLEQSGGYSSSAWLKGGLAEAIGLRPYLGVQWESYAPDSNGIQRISPLVGVERFLGPVRLFAEYRRAIENPRTIYSPNDPRLGVTAGHWWQSNADTASYLISDSYGELIFLPRLRTMPHLVVFSKLGWRFPLQKKAQLYLDPYLEAYVQESPDPALGRDAREARGGLRTAWSLNSWSISGSVFYRAFSLVSAPEAKVRFLLSVGGAL